MAIQWQKYVNSGKPLPATFPDMRGQLNEGNQIVWNGCTSWGTMANFKRVRVLEGHPPEKYSKLAEWWMSRKIYGQQIGDPNYITKNGGVYEDNALQTLIDFGPMLDQYDPELAVTNPTQYSWVQEYQLAPPDKWMANEKLQWSQVYQIDTSNPEQKLADTLDALANGLPVLMSFIVFPEIFNVGPNGMVPDPTPGEKDAGAHETNDTWADMQNQRIWFDNSWGPTWGNNGNGSISFDYFKKYAFELFVIVPKKQQTNVQPTPAPTPTPQPQPLKSIETDLQLSIKSQGVEDTHGNTCVPPELWQLVGMAKDVGNGLYEVNGKNYPGVTQGGVLYLNWEVMHQNGYSLKHMPTGWIFLK